MPKGQKPPRSAWKPGTSGNPGGRPKEVTEFVRKRRMKWLKKLDKLALAEPEIVKDEQGNPTEIDYVVDESVQLNALKELMRVGGLHAPTETKGTVDLNVSELSDDEVRRRVLLISEALEADKSEDADGSESDEADDGQGS